MDMILKHLGSSQGSSNRFTPWVVTHSTRDRRGTDVPAVRVTAAHVTMYGNFTHSSVYHGLSTQDEHWIRVVRMTEDIISVSQKLCWAMEADTQQRARYHLKVYHLGAWVQIRAPLSKRAVITSAKCSRICKLESH